MADRKRGRARNIDESRGHQDDSLNHSNKLFNNNNQNTLSSTWNKQQQQLQSQGRNVRSKFDGNHGQSDAEVEFDIPIEKPQIPEVEKQPDTMNRNRRLFAGLMGHLDLARKRLAADSTSIDKRNQALEAAKQRNEIKSKEIAEQLQKKIFHEKQKKQLGGDMNSLSARIERLRQSMQEFIAQQTKEKDYLVTSTQPALLWLPVYHNEATKQLLASRDSSTANAIAEREVATEEEIQTLENRFGELSRQMDELEREEVAPSDESVVDNSNDCNASSIPEVEIEVGRHCAAVIDLPEEKEEQEEQEEKVIDRSEAATQEEVHYLQE